MKRRHLLIGAAGAMAAPVLTAPAIVRAQAKYPDRTIKIVVPFAPAGPTDIIGRKAAEKLTALLGQTVIVENKAGAAGSIGAVEVKNAKPDGYTFLFAPSSTHAINPTAFVKPAYDAVKDFTPVSSVCVNPLVLVTHPSMPDSVMGLVELMKKNPGKYSYASSGNGSILHLAAEYFKREVGGMEVEHIPYKGSSPALQDVMSGQVAWMMETFSTTLQQHRAGKLRILAYAHAQRAPIAPEIPTMIEAGVKGYRYYGMDVTPLETPYEAGLGFCVKLDKGDFIGRSHLVQQKEKGLKRKLTGLKLLERGVPRPGCAVLVDGRGAKVPGCPEGYWLGPTILDQVTPEDFAD
mgnify:CR=1 FL=1